MHSSLKVFKQKLCSRSYVRQPHQTSDMLTNFKMTFFVIFENVDDLASNCKQNYGAAAKIGKVVKDYVQKG